MYLHISDAFLGFSFLALLVMSIERYLGAYYPIFHRTSVTRRRLLTLFAIFLIEFAVMYIISSYDLVIPTEVFIIIFMVLFFTPYMFVNFKLLTIARKMHRAVSPGKKDDNKFEKHIHKFMGCCLYVGIDHFKQCVCRIQSC